MKDNEKMFPKDNSPDWHKLTDAEFAKALSERSKKFRRVLTKPISELTNDEMMECIRIGRFDKPK